MSVTDDLKTRIAELSVALGVQTPVDGLGDDELLTLAESLEAEVADAEAKATAKAKKAKKPATPKPPFYVAPGRAITSKKGIISGDDGPARGEVKASYLAGGQVAIDALIESGHILKG